MTRPLERGHEIDGTHQGDFVSRDLSGSIHGDTVRIRSTYTERHGDALTFSFSGKVAKNAADDTMEGTLEMGEYLSAAWTAKRHVAPKGEL